MATQTLDREIAGLLERPLTPHEMRVEAMERLTRAIGVDSYCMVTVDPETLIATSHIVRGPLDRAHTPLVYRAEYGPEPDVGKHAELAASNWPVRVLSRSTRGELERSPRYREVLSWMGIRHELRAAVRERGTTWGFLSLHRGPDRRDFDPAEAALVERTTRALARVLRRSVIGPGVETTAARMAPSLMLLDEANRAMEGTAAGYAWLEALKDPEDPGQPVPEVFLALAERARILAAQGSADAASSRVRGADSAWYTAHASATDRGRVAVMVQPSQPHELVPLLLSHFRFTPAEQQVTELVLRGRSTKEIAADLVISPHTVQDRLKTVFDKVGLRSRRDLVATLNGPAA